LVMELAMASATASETPLASKLVMVSARRGTGYFSGGWNR
jgi:hypothetical protein